MGFRLLGIVLFALPVLAAERKPDNIPTDVWVREDLFAGYLVNDMERLARGEAKAADVLAANPNDVSAASWGLSAAFYRAILAYEAGGRAEFDGKYRKVIADFEKLHGDHPESVAVLAIYGGMISTLGHRLPTDLQPEANRRAAELFLKLEQVQKAFFDKMPVHHRGEVLSGVAQGAARSGQMELARKYLTRIVETLPGTPYAPLARRMLDDPALTRTMKVACNTCHEPNRLANYKPRPQ